MEATNKSYHLHYSPPSCEFPKEKACVAQFFAMRQLMPETWSNQISQVRLGQACVGCSATPQRLSYLFPFPFPTAPPLPQCENGAEKKDLSGKCHGTQWRAVKGWLNSRQCTGTGAIRAIRRTKHLLKVTQTINELILAGLLIPCYFLVIGAGLLNQSSQLQATETNLG